MLISQRNLETRALCNYIEIVSYTFTYKLIGTYVLKFFSYFHSILLSDVMVY